MLHIPLLIEAPARKSVLYAVERFYASYQNTGWREVSEFIRFL